MTPIDWTAASGMAFLIATGVVKWLIPGIRALQAPPNSNGGGAGTGHMVARDFGTMLERLGNLAELNERAQATAADDRESIGDALRGLGAAVAEQTKVLTNLVKITDATLVASTANSKILQEFHEAGAGAPIRTGKRPTPRPRKS